MLRYVHTWLVTPAAIGRGGLFAAVLFGERLMGAPEVVVHVVQRLRVRQVLNFLAEGVGEPGEAAHAHPHRQVLPLDIGRARLVQVGPPCTTRRSMPVQTAGL